MLAARMIQTFDFSGAYICEKLGFRDPDFELHKPIFKAESSNIIDLDGSVKEIMHPGNKSDRGVLGMTASNVPVYDFACKLKPRI